MSTILAFALALVSAPEPQTPRTEADASTFRVVNLREPVFRLWGLAPALAFWPMIVDDLKVTADQKARLGEIDDQFRAKQQAARHNPEFDQIAQANLNEAEVAIKAALEPAQWSRFEQIRLRLQGPTAFTLTDLPNRLGLSPEQVDRVRAIVGAGAERTERTASIPLPWPPDRKPTTIDELRDRVASPEFRAAKDAAWHAFFDSREATVRDVEAILTRPQKTAYRALLGQPFDAYDSFGPLRTRDTVDADVPQLARTLGIAAPEQANLGQRADPNFDTKVAKPAYAGDRHPKILFDEAHHNFHTATGRYKAFADLITNDGYGVTPNKQPFTPSNLAGFDVLVVANALGAEGMGHEDAGKSAFTDSESDTVRDWVEAGGSLLLITDHQPFGDAADALAKRFGVDMSKGVASDEANEQERGLLFARDKGLIGDHAITRGRNASERVDRVLTFTGQSLKGPEGSVPFLIFSTTAIDRGEARQTSAAGRAQGIAFARVKGRVVVMGEAAQLSAQVFGQGGQMGMNVPGSDNRKMALNTMHWLSRLID